MPRAKDLELVAHTERVQCRLCGDIHRVPVLFERIGLEQVMRAALEDPPAALSGATKVETIQVACPKVDYEHLETDWNIAVPFDYALVCVGEARL